MKKLWIIIVKLLGWRLILPEKGTRPEMERCVFVVAPHTSSFDFIIGATYLWSCCTNGRVFIKKEYFWGPLGWLLRKLGGISVDRGNAKNHMVESMVEEFAKGKPFSLAITPEGTRKPVKRWHRGFWEIACRAKVPIVPTYIDFGKKEIGAFDTIWPESDWKEEDRLKEKEIIQKVRGLYHASMAKHPENFVEA